MTFYIRIGGSMTTILNKESVTNDILRIGVKQHCTKLAINNIVFPKWDDNGLFGMMLRQCVRTKEFNEGHIYDEAEFQLILRVLDGKLLVSNRPDCYCWTVEKIKKEDMKGNIKPIGTNSANGLINLSTVILTIKDEKEKKLFAEMFASFNKDLMLIHSPAEERICIVVTQDMIDAGITYCVNSYDKSDENGDALATRIFVDDLLILEGTGVYRVGHEEALVTYRLGEKVE